MGGQSPRERGMAAKRLGAALGALGPGTRLNSGERRVQRLNPLSPRSPPLKGHRVPHRRRQHQRHQVCVRAEAGVCMAARATTSALGPVSLPLRPASLVSMKANPVLRLRPAPQYHLGLPAAWCRAWRCVVGAGWGGRRVRPLCFNALRCPDRALSFAPLAAHNPSPQVTQYVHAASHLMAIQIDAAINPGNRRAAPCLGQAPKAGVHWVGAGLAMRWVAHRFTSPPKHRLCRPPLSVLPLRSGGPALRGAGGGNVGVGVAFQNLPSADSIGYIIPIVRGRACGGAGACAGAGPLAGGGVLGTAGASSARRLALSVRLLLQARPRPAR